METICKPRISYNPQYAGTDHAYFVQLWYSYDGGKNFFYSGCGKSFGSLCDAETYAKEETKCE